MGTNEELWDRIEEISMYLDNPEEYVIPVDGAIVYPDIVKSGLFEFLELVLSDGDLFEDCTVRPQAAYTSSESLLSVDVGMDKTCARLPGTPFLYSHRLRTMGRH